MVIGSDVFEPKFQISEIRMLYDNHQLFHDGNNDSFICDGT